MIEVILFMVYIGRRSRYNEVVPIRAMEADSLSGGIAPLLPKLGCRWMCVVRLCALATLRPKKYVWCSLGWRLGVRRRWPGCFGEKIVLLHQPRFEPQIFERIS